MDDERVELEGGISHHVGEVGSYPEKRQHGRHRRPQRTSPAPANRSADQRKNEIGNEWTGWARGEVDERGEEHEVEDLRDRLGPTSWRLRPREEAGEHNSVGDVGG